MRDRAPRRSHTERHFARVFPAHVAGMCTLLIELRSAFGGDLDLALIMTVIGERHLARRLDPDMPTPETLGRLPVCDGPSINTLSLAEYTGIPRETARRQVALLVRRGWVAADGHGNLAPTLRAARELAPATRAAIAFLDGMFAVGTGANDGPGGGPPLRRPVHANGTGHAG